MSILIEKESPLMIIGITGKQGRNPLQTQP